MTSVVIDASNGVEMVAGTRRGAALAKLLLAEAEGWRISTQPNRLAPAER